MAGTLAERRAAFAARLCPPRDGPGKPATLGDAQGFPLRGLLFGGTPETIDCIFLHGGGYVMGSPAAQRVLAGRLAEHLGRTLFAVEYPRAPEAVWPAPLEAVCALLRRLRQPVLLVGSSAGGHLALNAALRMPRRVRRLVLFSPNTDRSGLSHTREPNTELDAMNADAGDRELWETAMPDALPDSPEASPVLADLSRLPPCFLSATEGEVLLGDTLLLARRLAELKRPHAVRIAPFDKAGLHMFESWPDVLPEGDEAVRAAAEFCLN